MRKAGKGRIDLAARAGLEHINLEPDDAGGFLYALQCRQGGLIAGINEHGNTNSLRYYLAQQS